MVHKVHDPRIYLWLVLSSEQHSARKNVISFQWPISIFLVVHLKTVILLKKALVDSMLVMSNLAFFEAAY